jgi:2-oxoglutarate ferredoxin oxidoreductase subunit gamma
LEWTLREAVAHPGFSFVEVIAPCSTAYARWNREGIGLDEKKLGRRGLEVMKHYQEVGRTVHGAHPKDAHIKFNEKGEITEIVEGEFLDEDRPDLQAAMEQRDAHAEKIWLAQKEALENRPELPAREDHVPRTEIKLGGFGGQGIISAGRIIGRAAAIHDKLEACFTQSYGPEARGGAAGAQVVISSDPIHHPHLLQPTNMIILSQGAYTKYVPSLAPGGVLLIDDELVILPEDHRTDITTHGISASKIAEKAGTIRAANTVMLGFWAAISGVISREAMRQAVAESVPSKTVELNLEVFDIGFNQGLEIGAEKGNS